ncbi:MAG: hypothetical protein KY463_09600, partial [Actinobacteria bacterium]|nr:hypothetical protein [Actinomycetota bacterium]
SAKNDNSSSAFPATGPVVPGTRATLRGSVAAAPAAAPIEVKRAIWAANQLRTKPYRYGGGHRSFNDSGYDCSGTVSFALRGGAKRWLKSPLDSGSFMRWSAKGAGSWITVQRWNGKRWVPRFDVLLSAGGRYTARLRATGLYRVRFAGESGPSVRVR